MSTGTLTPISSSSYSFTMLQDEVRQLVERGTVNRRQPIYVLCQYIPSREWAHVEAELERWDFLLRDHIGDLIATERWDND